MLEVFLRFDPTKHDIQNLNAVDMRGHSEKKIIVYATNRSI